MALSKTSTAITQLTASGTTVSVPTAAGIAPVISLHHSNGTGAITAAGTAQVQYQVNGALRWYAPPSLLVSFSPTAAQAEDRNVALPDAATAARIVYTVPAGAAAPTLDAEIATVTP